MNNQRPSTGGILKKQKSKGSQRVSWGQAQIRLMGSNVDYKENLDSKESSFSFRDSLSQERISLENKMPEIPQSPLKENSEEIKAPPVEDMCQFSDMFVQSSNINTIVIPSEHNLELIWNEKAMQHFLKGQRRSEKPLPQFTDKGVTQRTSIANKKESIKPVENERLEKMNKFIRNSINNKTAEVMENEANETTIEISPLKENAEEEKEKQIQESKWKAFNNLLKEQNINIVIDPNATAEEKYSCLKKIEEEIAVIENDSNSLHIVEQEKTPEQKQNSLKQSKVSSEKVQSNKAREIQEEIEQSQFVMESDKISFLDFKEEELSFGSALQNKIGKMFQYFKNEIEIFDKGVWILESEISILEEENNLCSIKSYLAKKFLNQKISQESKILYKKIYNQAQITCNEIWVSLEKNRNKKSKSRSEGEIHKLFIENFFNFKILNIYYLPKSRLFEVLYKFDEALTMIFNLEEDTMKVQKIRCLLDENAFSFVSFEEENDEEQGNLLCDLIMKTYEQKFSINELSLMENTERISQMYSKYSEVLKAWRDLFNPNLVQKIWMEKTGKIVCEMKLQRMPYLFVEFMLEKDEEINWSFTLKVHCLNNENHSVLQEVWKQVRLELVETITNAQHAGNAVEKIQAISSYLKIADFNSVKQKTRNNEYLQEKTFIPFDYN